MLQSYFTLYWPATTEFFTTMLLSYFTLSWRDTCYVSYHSYLVHLFFAIFAFYLPQVCSFELREFLTASLKEGTFPYVPYVSSGASTGIFTSSFDSSKFKHWVFYVQFAYVCLCKIVKFYIKETNTCRYTGTSFPQRVKSFPNLPFIFIFRHEVIFLEE